LEVLREVTFDDGDEPGFPELDLGEFFNFMEVFWEREGFLKRELADIARCFQRFTSDDDSESALVSTKEVGNMLLHMGYRVPAAELAQLVTELDDVGDEALETGLCVWRHGRRWKRYKLHVRGRH